MDKEVPLGLRRTRVVAKVECRSVHLSPSHESNSVFGSSYFLPITQLFSILRLAAATSQLPCSIMNYSQDPPDIQHTPHARTGGDNSLQFLQTLAQQLQSDSDHGKPVPAPAIPPVKTSQSLRSAPIFKSTVVCAQL